MRLMSRISHLLARGPEYTGGSSPGSDSPSDHQTRRWALPGRSLTTLAVVAVVAVGCGEGNDGSGPDGGSSEDLTTFQEQFDSNLEGVTYEDPPSGPTATKGKKIWVLSCNQAETGCSLFADGAVEAAEAIGWDVTLYDTKFDPSRMVQGVRQAIADDADAVVTYLTDCNLNQQALKDAKDAGLLTATAESLDCTKPLYDTVVEYTQGTYLEWLDAFAAAQATNAIIGADGEARVVRVTNPIEIQSTPPYRKAFDRALAECAKCEVVEDVEFVTADLGGPLQQKVQQAFIQHPDANVVTFPADFLIPAGVEAGLRASGRYEEVFFALAEGDPAALEQLRAGSLEGAGVGLSPAWEGWSAIDNLNRLFQGEDPASSGIGIQTFDADNNIPPTGIYQPPIAFRDEYLKMWGIE